MIYVTVSGHEVCGQVHSIGKETCDGRKMVIKA
jgi:D-arabinose 1-dehydrogenase-like Zn-dependent alcohol dehydrogenase